MHLLLQRVSRSRVARLAFRSLTSVARPDEHRREGRIVGYDGIATLPAATTRRMVVCIMSEPGFAGASRDVLTQTLWGQSFNLNAWMSGYVRPLCRL